MSDPQRSTNDRKQEIDDEDLVAYLDGELKGDARDQLEQQLVDDEDLRTRLRDMQESWEMLDHLPDPPPTRDLVESTMEMAVVDVTRALPAIDADEMMGESAGKSPSPFNRFVSQGGLRFLAAIAVTMALGAALGLVVRQRRIAQEAERARLAANLDALMHGDDLEFMRWLPTSEAWSNWVRVKSQDNSAQSESSAAKELLWSDEPIETSLSNWTSTGRTTLAGSLERLEQMDPAQIEKLKRAAKTLQSQTDRDALLETMHQYARFREGLTAAQRDALENGRVDDRPAGDSATSDGDRRERALEKAVESSMKALTRRSVDALDDEAVDAIYQAAIDVLRQRLRNKDPMVSTVYRTVRRLTRQENPDWLVVWRLFGDRGPINRREGPPGMLPKLPPSTAMTNAELDLVFLSLPVNAADQLQSIAGQNELLSRQILVYWVEEAIRRRGPKRSSGGRQDAVERYTRLPEEVRDELDLLPPDDFFRILSNYQSKDPERRR